MKRANGLKKFVQTLSQMVVASCCVLALTFVWQGLFLAATPDAIALPRGAYSNLSSQSNDNAGEKVKQNAQAAIDRVGGTGSANQLEGQAKQAYGKVEQKVNEAGGKAKGTAKQVEGRAQKDFGRTENAAERARDKAGNVAENAIDTVKDFFN